MPFDQHTPLLIGQLQSSPARPVDIPDPETQSHLLHCYSVPEGFREWCSEHKIQGHLFEHFDGGGSTGFTIEFADSVAKALAAEKFSGWGRIWFPSDGVLDRGNL